MTEPRCVNAHDLCWQGGPCPYCEKPTRKQTKGLAHILPICENKSPGRGNEAAAGENKQMTNLTALIRTARANRAAAIAAKASILVSGSASEGNVCVSVIPVQPRGMSSKWSERADVYMGGKRLKTAEVAAILKAEAGQ